MKRDAAALLLFCLSAGAVAQAASETPDAGAVKEAGKDVPAPARIKYVMPKYPAQALARGERGLVVLEVVVDERGGVAEAKVLHGTPAFSDAAVEAVKQWRYEVTRVAGHPVRVKLVVPLSFAAKLPEMLRERGIPELRQGAVPLTPPEGGGQAASVVVRAEIDARGWVTQTTVQNGDAPWSDALTAAVHTWRFADPETGAGLTIDVHADFKGGRGGKVELELTKVQAAPERAAENAAPPASAAATPSASTDSGQPPTIAPAPGGIRTEPPPAGAPPTGAPPPAALPTEKPKPEPHATEAPAPTAEATTAAVTTPKPAASRPPVEVIGGQAPPPPAAAAVPPAPAIAENGISTIRDVQLGPGLPDLVRGRRPVAPPLVRMSGAYGDVSVRFSIDSGGVTSVTSTEGADPLKEAAESLVRSWGFRRTLANRVFAVARIHYAADGSSAKVDVAGE